jgi:hypothetical protein
MVLLLAAAGVSAQTRGEIGRKAGGGTGRRVAEVVQPSARRPLSVMLSEDQLSVLIIGLDGQERRSASIVTAGGARRGRMTVVDHGVSTTLEISPGPKGGGPAKYSMDVDETGLARLSSRPEASAARIINAFMDFWLNAPRTLCPGNHIERCLPLNLPL